MTIKKIFNNNVVLTENEAGREIIAMGRGIGFNRRVGEKISDENVERIYTLSSKSMMDKFQELIAGISSDYLQISNEIIDYAQNFLKCKLNESTYVSLTDLIHMAIYRIQNGVEIRSMFLMEIQKFYEKEYQVGIHAVKIINEHFKIEMPEDEAVFIALHIVDAQMDFNIPIANKIMQMIQEITNVIRMTCRIEFDKNALSYYRLVAHLKFFAKRIFTEQESSDEIDDDMNFMMRKKVSSSIQMCRKNF